MVTLLTGGSGRLGQELQKLRVFNYIPSRAELDITNFNSVRNYVGNKKIDLIVHCAANVSTDLNKISNVELYKTNVEGTRNMGFIAPILYISSEYVFDGVKGNYNEQDEVNPVNYYGETKALGEAQALYANGKIIRVGRMASRPWPYSVACNDMYTSGDYIDIMAKEINIAISEFEYLPIITHIGTNRKSVLELAQQTFPTVEEIGRKDLNSLLPCDCSFDTRMWNVFKDLRNKNEK